MPRRNPAIWRVLALMLALVLVAAACGGDDDDSTGSDTTTPTGNDGDASGGDSSLSGQIVVSGSSTVEPISARNAEKFNRLYPNVAISVDGPGTGDGFEIFCNGESDVSDASRPIKAEEIEKCEANGIEFIELKVAIDGLSVITSTRNDAVECLSFADLYALLGPESTGFDRWADASGLAAELPDGYGALHTPYPDAPLVVTAPGEESGTYDTFVELALQKIAKERDEAVESRPDYQASPNDNVIIDGIAGTETSLGWVGYAFVEENLDKVKPLEVDGGDGCVEPTPETIASGEFPLARPLYIYVNKAKAESNPALEAYIELYMSDDGFASVTEVGYVGLESDETEATRAAWTAREIGTREG